MVWNRCAGIGRLPTDAQKNAYAVLEAETKELLKNIGDFKTSIAGMRDYLRIMLWHYSEFGKIIGIDLVPSIGVIEKPVIPNAPTTDPPANPDQPNTTDTKEHFKLWGKETKWEKSPLNWFLLIVCFGWLWMAF